MSWHAANICLKCWENKFPREKQPIKITIPEIEICCYCGEENKDGIYFRDNAKEIKCQHDK